MKALMIKDLSRADTLDRAAMTAVSGGMYKGGKGGLLMPGYGKFDLSSSEFSFNASQAIGQSQNTVVNNGNNVAFVHGITANVKPTQTANNTINFG